jgi:pimeloyl-ACP methyl ester carboxylesterase
VSAKFKSSITDFGGDGKTIILLHGFLASSIYWKKLQPYLSAAGYRVITIDLLGFGRAPKPRHSDYSYDEHISYLRSAIKNSHVPTPYTVVGHSMGALLAARYARIFPNEVTDLILLHPPLYKDSMEAYATLRSTNKIYRFLLDSHLRRIGWIAIKMLAGYYISNHGRHARERSLKNIIEKAEAFDDLTFVTVSTLLVIGSNDRSVYAKNLAGHSTQSTVTVKHIPSSHHSPITETELVQKLILDFITIKT